MLLGGWGGTRAAGRQRRQREGKASAAVRALPLHAELLLTFGPAQRAAWGLALRRGRGRVCSGWCSCSQCNEDGHAFIHKLCRLARLF
jgi:hypothetical protein